MNEMRAINVALLTAVALVSASGIASAKQEKQVTRIIWEISDFPGLEKAALAVCSSASEKGSRVVLSDKAKDVCASKHWPSITKAGLFRNTGVGAELNTLMRQASNPPAPAEQGDKQ